MASFQSYHWELQVLLYALATVPSSPFSLGTAATQPGVGTGGSKLVGFRLRAGRCLYFVSGDKPCCMWGGGAGCGAGRDVWREARAGSGRDRKVGFAWRGRVLSRRALKRESGSTAQLHPSGDTALVGLNHGLGSSSPRGARPQHRCRGQTCRAWMGPLGTGAPSCCPGRSVPLGH